MFPSLLQVKRILLIGFMIADAVIHYFCAGATYITDKEDEEENERTNLQFVQAMERASAVANSNKKGTALPVPGGVPGTGQEGVAAPAVGPKAKTEMVVTNGGSTTLTAVNPDGTPAKNITVPSGFGNLSATPDGQTVAGTAGSILTAYNTSSGAATVTANLANGTPAGQARTFRPSAILPTPIPGGTAIMPDSSGAYVTDKSAASYYWVSFTDQSVKAYNNSVSPAGSGKPAILPNGAQLWIPNTAANTITVYDTFTNTLVTTISGVTSPTEVAFTGDGTRAAVVSRPAAGNGSVYAIDTTQYSVLGSVPVGYSPAGISVNPYGTDFWVANNGSGTISDVETSGSKPVLVETDPVGTNPGGAVVLNTFVR